MDRAGKMSWVELVKDPTTITISVLWEMYARNIFTNVEVSSAQYSETKQAFYVGFSECFKLMSDIAGDLPEDKACEMFSRIAVESNTFLNSLIARKIHG